MDITNQNLSILTQAFNASFQAGLQGMTPMWNQIATPVTSTTAEEKYGWLGDSFAIREWLGDRRVQALKAYDYTIKNRKFEGTVGVPRDTIDDDQYGTFGARFRMMGDETARFPDVLTFALLLAGFSTVCYDGQYFFDTDHPVGLPGAEVSVSNYGGGAGAAWFLMDTTRFIKPLLLQTRRPFKLIMKDRLEDENVFNRDEFVYGVDGRMNVGFGLWQLAYASKQTLDATAYEAALATMSGFKKDSGAPLGIKPNILLVGPTNWATAKKVVEAETLANGATNTNRNTTTVVMCPYLT